MITRYRFELTPDRAAACRVEWSYYLYCALMERIPREYAQKIHENGPSPISQYLYVRDGRIFWNVTLLGDEAREKLAPLLETETVYCLRQEQLKLRAERRAQEEIASLEVLFPARRRGFAPAYAVVQHPHCLQAPRGRGVPDSAHAAPHPAKPDEKVECLLP